MDLALAKALETEAVETNNGNCTHCHQTIKIYRYGISDSMVTVLRAMAKSTTPQAGRAIDVDAINLRHSERTQLTKLRFHGLVAKVKDDDGTQVARHWLITRKGWAFLGGEDIQEKVVVYNNQVLGHEGGTTNIRRIAGGNGEFEQQPITQAESRTYAHVREPEYDKTVKAVWLGYSIGQLVKGQTYMVKMQKLQVGKPIKIQVPGREPQGNMQYPDIASFARSWQVVQ